MADPQTCADLFRRVDFALLAERADEARLCAAAPSHIWTPSPAYQRRFGPAR